jgi:urease accessory protein
MPIITNMLMGMIMGMSEAMLYRLMTWLSPAYPVGAYSYSHGLEFAVEQGLLPDAKSLTGWISSILRRGAGQVDGALLASAWRAADAGDEAALQAIAERAAAWRGSAELVLEADAQGAAFLSATRAAWPHVMLDRLALLQARHAIPLPVAIAVAAACHAVPLAPTLSAYLHSFAANLVSAGMRLIPLGQSAGQAVIAALEPVVADAARAALEAELDEVGTAVPVVDWCSMQHETQYTRLFRS